MSDNESLAVFDPASGQLVKARPEDSRGRLVPYVRQDVITGVQHDRQTGWWYGALVADGWHCGNTVGYSKLCRQRLDEFVRVARAKWGESFTVCEYSEKARPGKFSDSIKVHLNTAPDRALAKGVFSVLDPEFYRTGLANRERGALYKMIPEELLRGGSRECLLGLVAGLLDGDSTVGWNKARAKPRPIIKLNTSSPYLVESFKILFRKLGVRYAVTVMPPRGRSKTSYVFMPSIPDMHRLFGELEFFGAETRRFQQEFLASVPGRANGDVLDIVPITTNLAQTIAQLAIRGKQVTLYGTFRNAALAGSTTRYSARKAMELFGRELRQHPDYERLVAVTVNEEISWEIVQDVEPIGKERVCDFEIESTKVYSLQNGLIVWDTSNFHLPATDEARDEALAKMLPSRNLTSVSDFKEPMYQLRQEYLGGLFSSTRRVNHEKKPRVFATQADALRAWQKGEMNPDDPVEIVNSEK